MLIDWKIIQTFIKNVDLQTLLYIQNIWEEKTNNKKIFGCLIQVCVCMHSELHDQIAEI